MSEKLELDLIRAYLQRKKTPWSNIRKIASNNKSSIVKDLFIE